MNHKMIFAVASVLLVATCHGLVSAQEKPLKVYLLVGQSNMQGHAHVRTLPHMGMDKATRPILDVIQDQEGQNRVIDDVWISYLSSGGVKSGKLTTGYGADENKMGPELAFGIYMQKKVGEPILIIKAAWGGKSLNTDFRPPSAGPFEFDDSTMERFKKQNKNIDEIKAAKVKATGVYYKKTIEHVKNVLKDLQKVYPDYDSKRGYELAGMVWFQGWNDMVDGGTYPNRGKPGGYDQYSQSLEHFIRDIRKDLNAPELPFVIGVMGVGGPTSKYGPKEKRYQKIHQSFRDAMAAPAKSEEFKENTFVVLTEKSWDMELADILARDAKFRQMAKQIKTAEDLRKAFEKSSSKSEVDDELEKKIKEFKSKRKLENAVLEMIRARELSEREFAILKTGKSNAAFHYLGSAKIMAKIGKSFADAMPVDK